MTCFVVTFYNGISFSADDIDVCYFCVLRVVMVVVNFQLALHLGCVSYCTAFAAFSYRNVVSTGYSRLFQAGRMTLARRVTVSVLACAPWLVLEVGNRRSSFFFLDPAVEALEGMDLLVLNHRICAACNQFCHYVICGDVLVKGGVRTEVVMGSSCFKLWWSTRHFALASSSSIRSSRSSGDAL